MNKGACNTFFAMLSTRSRLDIIMALHEGEKSVSEICDSVGVERTNVSHQLKRLLECGFVFGRREGRKRIYSLNSENVKPILDLAERHVKKYYKPRRGKKVRCSPAVRSRSIEKIVLHQAFRRTPVCLEA